MHVHLLGVFIEAHDLYANAIVLYAATTAIGNTQPSLPYPTEPFFRAMGGFFQMQNGNEMEPLYSSSPPCTLFLVCVILPFPVIFKTL